jgi:hypothetical protein
MFVQLPQAKHKSVAFLPHTFRFISPVTTPDKLELAKPEPSPDAYGSTGYHVGAYWHEISGDKHVTALGIAMLILSNQHLPEDPRDLTYERMLEVAEGHRDLYRGYIQFNAARKIGNRVPYRRDAVLVVTSIGAAPFDFSALDEMREDITYLPENSDGWYARRPGVKA